MTEDQHLVNASLQAASALLGGVPLTIDGAALRAGGGRAVVIRARRSDNGKTVIVKGYDRARAGDGWIRETAALTALERLGVSAPRVIAAEAALPVLVMTDLGAGGSLADSLLGTSAPTAERGILDWAIALADLHSATWDNVEVFETALAERSGTAPTTADAMPGLLGDGVRRLEAAADALGVEVPDEVGPELLHVASEINRAVRVVSPSDACPDNNVRTSAGLVLIDFEGATVAHPAWDLAYLRVPWPSCWCAWQLPEAVADRAEQAWLQRLETGLASRGLDLDRAAMNTAIELASLVWCLITVGWFLPGALDDRRAGGEGSRSPRLRALVQHRLALLIASDEDSLSAGRDLASRLNSALVQVWPPESLQLAPAFRC